MAKIHVMFQSEKDRERVVWLCRRLGEIKVEETSVTLKTRGIPTNKIMLFLGTHPEVISVRRLRKRKKNKAAQ